MPSKTVEPNELKYLLLDTEWSYAIYYGFPSKKPQYMPARNIKHRQFCTNASWLWNHKTKCHNVSLLDDPKQFKKDFRNDKVCAVALHKAMSEADVIVAHNLKEFDVPMINVMFVLYGLGPIPETKFIDTLKVARKYFRFAGNGLDDLLKFFGHAGKAEKPDWVGLTEGDPEQIRKSVKYCDVDVYGLKIVFDILKPYMIHELPKPRDKAQPENYGIMQCDSCGSKRLLNKGLGGAAGKPFPRVRCAECGHEHKGDIKIYNKVHNAASKKK